MIRRADWATEVIFVLLVIPVFLTSGYGGGLARVPGAKEDFVSKPCAPLALKNISIINAAVDEQENGRRCGQKHVYYRLRDLTDLGIAVREMFGRDKHNLRRIVLIEFSLLRQVGSEEQLDSLVVYPSRAIAKVSDCVRKFYCAGISPDSTYSYVIHPQLTTFGVHDGVDGLFHVPGLTPGKEGEPGSSNKERYKVRQ